MSDSHKCGAGFPAGQSDRAFGKCSGRLPPAFDPLPPTRIQHSPLANGYSTGVRRAGKSGCVVKVWRPTGEDYESEL